jgi:hypoxanthine phosphoribosyltransferase
MSRNFFKKYFEYIIFKEMNMNNIDPTVIAACITAGVSLIGLISGGIFAVWKWIPERTKLNLENKKLSKEIEIIKTSKEIYPNSSDQIKIETIRQGLYIIENKLKEKAFKPDILVSFNRNGTVAAGMLAPNLKVDEIVAISRVPNNSTNRTSTSKKTYSTGNFIRLLSSKWQNKNILIIFMLIDTGETLSDGLTFLKNEGIQIDNPCIQVATVFITPGAINRWPNTIFAFDKANRDILEKLPWIYQDYDYR